MRQREYTQNTDQVCKTRMSGNADKPCLVLFSGGVETQEFFALELAKAWDEMGYTIFFYNLMREEESYNGLEHFVQDMQAENRRIVMFSFNFNGLAGEKYLYRDDGSIFWEEKDILCINMVLDHPFYYHRYIANLPAKYIQISIDKNHERYMQRFFPDIALGGFVPLAGTHLETGEEMIPLARRPMDIIMTGNYTKPQSFDKYIAHLDREYIDFYHSILDTQLANPCSTLEEIAEPMLREALTEDGELSDDDIKSCYANMIFIDLWTRFEFRGRAVAAIADAGVRIHTFGEGWDELSCCRPENIICHGGCSSQQCLEAIAQSKLSLNVMPWFKDGAHDRVFNTMLNGAVCVSDDSKYLREILTDGSDAAFYSLENMDGLACTIRRLLSDEDEMNIISKNGFETASSCHTWAHRAKSIEKLFYGE